MKRIKHIHFVGIKGVGMTPLAIIAKEAGFVVTGSDIVETFITDSILQEAGIIPLVGFDPSHIDGAQLVITTGAHGGYDNVEVIAAKEKGIPVWLQGQAVGEFMKGDIFHKKYIGISVAGTHGKTTTTAMVATLFEQAKRQPSYVIGTASVPSLGKPGHKGKGMYFIAEADEYATDPIHDQTTKFLWQHPKIAVVTNIELDHTDFYHTVDDLRHAFLEFLQNLPTDGLVIACGDDPQVQILLKQYNGKSITYGFSPSNDYVIKHISLSANRTSFWVDAYGTSLGEFFVRVLGEHNALNALAAIITAFESGISIDTIKKALPNFVGSKRRAEYRGELVGGAQLFDDYAHHPTEIKKTLIAFANSYPKHKIVCIFQPHTYSRTKELYPDFLKAFDKADTVILLPIYASMREELDSTITSQKLAQDMASVHKNVTFLPTSSSVVEYINKKAYPKDTIILTMGAGDVYKISEKLKMQSVK